MVSQAELQAVLETLARDQRVTVRVVTGPGGWYRAQVISHDPGTGQLVLTCFMDRPSDRPLRPGQRVIVAANRLDDELHAAPMEVEQCTSGSEPTLRLRMAGAWQADDERRNQVRVPLQLRASRARRWVGGAWRELEAVLVDLSSRGVGLTLSPEVQLGDRVSLVVPLGDGKPDLRVTVEVRHMRQEQRRPGFWRAGGMFRNLPPADHERIIRFIFAELRSRPS